MQIASLEFDIFRLPLQTIFGNKITEPILLCAPQHVIRLSVFLDDWILSAAQPKFAGNASVPVGHICLGQLKKTCSLLFSVRKTVISDIIQKVTSIDLPGQQFISKMARHKTIST